MSQPLRTAPNGNRVVYADLEPRRQEALAYLRRHVHDGDLTLEEYGIRVERALLAASPNEILLSVEGLPTLQDPVTARLNTNASPQWMPIPADQPAAHATTKGAGQARGADPLGHAGLRVDSSRTARPRTVLGIFSEAKLKGRWRGGRSVSVLSLFGGATVDLREAILSEDELVITGLVAFGSLQVIVPPGADIDVSSLVIFGSRRQDDDDIDVLPGMPRITVNVAVLFGDVTVKVRGLDKAKRRSRKR